MKIIKFSAEWCGPCGAYAPVFDKTVKKFPDLEVQKVDVEKNPEIAARFRIMSIPVTIIIDDKSEVVSNRNGVLTEDQLEDLINLYIKK